jgi:hypothetical protein
MIAAACLRLAAIYWLVCLFLIVQEGLNSVVERSGAALSSQRNPWRAVS